MPASYPVAVPAAIAYAAWAKAQAIIPPSWDHLNDTQQRAWCAAAMAILVWVEARS